MRRAFSVRRFQPILLQVAVPCGACALALIWPPAAIAGVWLRYTYGLGLLLLAGLLYLAFLPTGRTGALAGLLAGLVLFELALAGLWRSAGGEMHVLGGLVYFSDTAGFYWDANRLLDGGLFSALSARRPLLAGFLAGLLGLAGRNLRLSLAVLVAICAISCVLAAQALRRSHGPAAAAGFLLLLFLFYRRFIGLTDTENLGLALGAAGFALLWRSARRAQIRPGLLGTFLLALALNARAGAFLVLPALLVWAGLTFHQGRAWFRPVLAFSLAIGLAFGLNLLVFRVTSAGQGAPFANYADTFYGMASGGTGWEQARQVVPAGLADAEASRQILSLAWQKVQADPARLAGAVLNQYRDFFSLKDESVWGFAAGPDLLVYDAPRLQNVGLYRAARLLLYGLSALALARAVRRPDPAARLLLLLTAGIVLSVAFLPPRDAGLMRVYAATLPVMAALPALGLAALLGAVWAWIPQDPPVAPSDPAQRKALALLPSWLAGSAGSPSAGRFAIAWGLFLSAAVVCAPLAVRAWPGSDWLPAPVACRMGEQSALVRIDPGSFVFVTGDPACASGSPSAVCRERFLAGLSRFPHQAEVAKLAALPGPLLLQNALDVRTGRAFWLALQTNQPPIRAGLVALCGQWDPDFKQQGLDLFTAVAVEG